MAGRFSDIEDLDTYCQALEFGPRKIAVVRQAVKEHIAANLASNRPLRERFMAIKAGQTKAAVRGLRVIK